MKLSIRFLVVLTISIAACVSASASSTSSASVGPLSVQLTDLNPTDGIGPSIVYLPFGFDSETWVQAGAYQSAPTVISENHSVYGATVWQPVSVQADVGAANSTSTVAGNGTPSATVLSSHGDAGDPVVGTLAYGTEARSNAFGGRFVLSANTSVTFSGLASVYASSTTALGKAFGSVEFGLHGAFSGGPGYSSDIISVGQSFQNFVGSSAASRVLHLTFTNTTAADMAGVFQIRTSATGQTSAVPEPEVAFMFLGGLVCIACVRRRSIRR